MQIYKLARTIQGSREMFYHGTCSTLARKILTQGFNPEPKRKVWGDPDDPKRSYGGTYLSKNFMVAYGAARTATERIGGNRVIFEAQVETRQTLIDEDEIPGFEGRLSEIAGVSYNPRGAQIILEETSRLNEVLEGVTDRWLEFLESSRGKYQFDPKYLAHLREPLKAYIIARLEKEAAGKSINEEDAKVRAAKTDLMNAIGSMARMKVDVFESMENVRTLQPIGFRGANQIKSATEVIRKGDDSYVLKCLYGKPSPDFLNEFQRNVSGEFTIEH
jgi:hypothetical protein